MARINNQAVYPLDSAIDLGEYLIGTDSNGTTTLNYQLNHLFRTFIDLGNGFFVLHTDVDTAISLYDYHSGNDWKGDWVVIRYEKADVTARLIANEINNPSILTELDAWNNKETLVYS